MSGAHAEEVVRSAVPIADLSALDVALVQGEEALREAVKKVRPADVGRDFARRPMREARRMLEASEDRRAAAMLRAAHPAAAARLLGSCDPAHGARLLGFMPTDVETSILAIMPPADRVRI